MGLLDFFTGGKAGEASDALARAEKYFSDVKLPSLSELTLPELQKYVEAGVMTPAEARAYLQERNAYEDQDINQTGTAAQISALNQLSQIANAGAEGTPMQQAQMENALQKMRTADAGSIGAIEQAMAARGTPRALIQAALASQVQGQNQQQAHMDAVNANAAMYQNALNALSQQGGLGSALQGQQNAQANQVAAAANAMQQFNAANQAQTAQFNAANQQAANAMNTANRQQIANNNVGLSNARTQYNAGLPQQMFGNAMSKAQGQAGAATNIGNLYNQQGQQNAGIIGGLINTASSFIPKAGGAAGASGMPGYQAPMNPTTQGFNQGYQQGWYAHGGIVRPSVPPPVGSDRGYYDRIEFMNRGGYVDDPMYCAEGAMIPGDAEFPGDTLANDTVPIMASPGEAVIPRSSVQENPEIVSSLLNGEADVIDPMDVATLLKAMRAIRAGVC